MANQTTVFSLSVFSGDDFVVRFGVNDNDPVGLADTLMLDDVYRLNRNAVQKRLGITTKEGKRLVIAHDSGIGRVGADITIDCHLTLMAADAQVVEALSLVLDDSETPLVILPLETLKTDTDYRLVGVDRHAGKQALARFATVSFSRGTHVTLANGAQRAIEDLRPGDKVLTRDAGPQTARWIGHYSQRATGALAPIRISAGALNNANELVLSPDHRLLLYQRIDRMGVGKAEVVVKARDLINGHSISQLDVGFVDYYQILLDKHHMIFAEGIAAEATFASALTTDMVADGFAPEDGINHARQCHTSSEIAVAAQNRTIAAELMRRAAAGE